MSNKEYVILPKGDAQTLVDIVKEIDARQKAAQAADREAQAETAD